MLDEFSEISNEEAICEDRSSMDLVPGIPSKDAARPVESHESQEISESLMKIEDSCSKQAADNKLISDLSTIKTPEGKQT